jgi:hypothetical protein
MGFIVMSDSYPGAWGAGDDEAAARVNWKRAGGRGGSLVVRVNEAYTDLFVDFAGCPKGTPGPSLDGVSPQDWPVFDEQVWRVGPRGARVDITHEVRGVSA